MQPSVNNDLQIAYEIGLYIASMIPRLDDDHGDINTSWCGHKDYFISGPNPFYSQLAQGIILQTSTYLCTPHTLLTTQGNWSVLGGTIESDGSIKKIFEIIKEKLNLKPLDSSELDEYKLSSFWAVQTWNGANLPEPAYKKRSEYLSYESCEESFKEFQRSLNTAGKPLFYTK